VGREKRFFPSPQFNLPLSKQSKGVISGEDVIFSAVEFQGVTAVGSYL
jgi:hypothetical protein